MKTGPWSPSDDRAAQDLLLDGYTFSEVGAKIDRPRNAVLGRAHRKNWDYPGKGKRRIGKPPALPMPREIMKPMPKEEPPIDFGGKVNRNKSVVPSRIKPPPPLDPAPVEPPPNTSMLLSDPSVRDRHCRFIFGDSRGMLICGQHTVEGRSWCETHDRLVRGKGTRSEQMAFTPPKTSRF